ncbi:MAG TPA: hypothetical protein VKH64_08510 [Candidatus Binatia bacterium]|nr:hypothetical protein [Candidatus Binatia bacterium]
MSHPDTDHFTTSVGRELAVDELGARGHTAWLRSYGFVIALYAAISVVTGAAFMGDTIGYADSILESKFFEFGHLLWFPLGWLASVALAPITGLDPRLNVIFALIAVNWGAGLLSVVLLHSLARKLSEREWPAIFATIGFIFSQAFLDLVHSGCSYIPGLSSLVLGLWLLFRAEDQPRHATRWAILAGAAFATAVALWFPYVTAVPGALLSTLLVYGFTRQRFAFVIRAGFAFGCVAALIYGTAALAQGIYTFGGLVEWIHSSSHGITDKGNLPRLLFGIPRSFTFTGRDGSMFKRFLYHDPYNPVSLLDLFQGTLAKIMVFYFLIAGTAIVLLRTDRGRRLLAFLGFSTAPLLALAFMWEAGAIERYLPIYPVLFLSLSYALARRSRFFLYETLAGFWIAMNIVVNTSAMANSTLAAHQQRVAARVEALQPLLKPQSAIATLSQLDELWAFPWDFPFNPINQKESLSTYHIQEPGTTQIPVWRQNFAAKARSVWSAGGDFWISKRLLASRPKAEWNWVEGDDPRITWRDIYEYFSQFDYGQAVGGDDGFVILARSPRNYRSLDHFTNPGNS